jgi:hypothetical protein
MTWEFSFLPMSRWFHFLSNRFRINFPLLIAVYESRREVLTANYQGLSSKSYERRTKQIWHIGCNTFCDQQNSDLLNEGGKS